MIALPNHASLVRQRQPITVDLRQNKDGPGVAQVVPLHKAIEIAIAKTSTVLARAPPLKLHAVWSPEELEAIRTATDSAMALRQYRAAFPESTRSDDAVKRRWTMFGPGRAPHVRPRKEKPPRPVGVPNSAWEPQEDAVLTAASSRQDAVQRYRAAFPEAKRTVMGIYRRRSELLAAERAGAPRPKRLPQAARLTHWSLYEKAVVLMARNRLDGAVLAHRAVFPDSGRSYDAIDTLRRRLRRGEALPRVCTEAGRAEILAGDPNRLLGPFEAWLGRGGRSPTQAAEVVARVRDLLAGATMPALVVRQAEDMAAARALSSSWSEAELLDAACLLQAYVRGGGALP